MDNTDELSLSNGLVIDSPCNGVKETTDPEEITDPKMLSLITKTNITDDSPQTGEVVTGWDASALRQSCLSSSAQYDQSITGGELCKVLLSPEFGDSDNCSVSILLDV